MISREAKPSTHAGGLHRDVGFLGEGMNPKDDEECNDSYSPYVQSFVVRDLLAALALEHLRRQILARAANGAHTLHGICDEAREPKVGNHRFGVRRRIAQKDVFGLEIAVNHSK